MAREDWPLVVRSGFGTALHAGRYAKGEMYGGTKVTVLEAACGKTGLFLSGSDEAILGPSCRTCLRKMARS